jgi:cbb3-type cytochrome oxidase maturation protein
VIASTMDILFLLVPFSVLLVLALIGLFAWAIQSNQFDDLQREGERILEGDAPEFDADQGPP